MAFLKNISNPGTSDLELLAMYKRSRDLKLLGTLYERYMELVYGVCLKYLKDNETARDAVMQIFEELVAKLDKYEVDNFKSWLYTLAKNYCLMQLRSPKNLKTVEWQDHGMQSTDETHLNGMMEKEEEFGRLEKCLDGLPGDQRETVRLFYLQDKCYKDIAGITGKDWNKIRSLIQNGRRNLKICMEKKGEVEIKP